MRQRPRICKPVKLIATGALLLASLPGCAADPDMLESSHATAGIRGTLRAVAVDGPGAEAGLRYWLKREDGQGVMQLVFEHPPADFSRAPVVVYGSPINGVFTVTAYEFIGNHTEEAIAAQPLTGQSLIKTRTVGFAIVNYYARGLSPANASVASQAASYMYSTTNPGPNLGIGPGDKSVRQYYDEVSYGMFRMSQGTGPGVESGGGSGIAYSGGAGCGDNNCDVLASALTPSLTGTYDHHIWYYGTVLPECNGGYGWGSQGTWSKPEGEIWFNGEVFDGAITHEIGHNLGFQHASTIKCGTVPLADDPLTCTTVEYGNTVSIMGNMGNGHMMGLEKWYAGWLLGCNGVRVKSTGTFTLFPLEAPCNGVQTLQVPMPKTSRKFATDQSSGNNPLLYYYLELRTNQGLDSGQKNQIMVHASDDIKAQSAWCARNVQLDMKPSTSAVDGMVAGDIFTDPAGGVTITVNSLSAAQASVTVTLTNSTGSNTCIDGSTLSGSGPASCSDSTAGGGSGAGGTSSTGGTTATSTAKGGTSSTGGTTATSTAKGGASSAGGTTATSTAKGGASSTGGNTAKGGTTATSTATGTATGNGGASSGGTSPISTLTTGGSTAVATTGVVSVGGSPLDGSGGGTATLGGGTGLGLGGAVGAPTTNTSTTASGTDASGATAGDATAGDDGCGCRVVETPKGPGRASVFALAVLGLGFVRRRKGAPRPASRGD